MKTLFLFVISSLLSNTVLAHEGLHAVGQMNLGNSHMNLFEISLTVLVALACYAWARKKIK